MTQPEIHDSVSNPSKLKNSECLKQKSTKIKNMWWYGDVFRLFVFAKSHRFQPQPSVAGLVLHLTDEQPLLRAGDAAGFFGEALLLRGGAADGGNLREWTYGVSL